jgi:Tat protein secretion system quality control protein TatD with DNase activity
MLVDSHCHLDFPDFQEDLEGVVSRAREAGVGHFLTICTHLTKFDQVRAVAARFDDMHCTVGIHPHEAEHEPPTTPKSSPLAKPGWIFSMNIARVRFRNASSAAISGPRARPDCRSSSTPGMRTRR